MEGDWQVPGYRPIRDLGEGSAGRVVLAVHIATDTPVAIKYLSLRLLADEDFLTRFRAEARMLAGLDDPNLVRFYEYIESVRVRPGVGPRQGAGTNAGAPVGSAPRGAAIVMELVDGISLARLLIDVGPTGPEAALAVLKGSLLGLAAAHAAGVVHRDYKPGNILVRGDGASKLADFGIAVRAGDNVPAAGTPAYMPPEQWSGRPVTPATDVYAATAVFFECLTGDRPYPGQTLPQLALAHRTAPIPVERVPQALRGLISHGLAKTAHDRPRSAAAFLDELETTALAAYGPDWEKRGRNRLAELAALLALLFPLAGTPSAKDASALAHTELGSEAGAGAGMAVAGVRRRTARRFAATAACVAAMLLLGGTGIVIYTANSSNDGEKRPAAAGPSVPVSGDPSAGPSVDPSTDPSDDPSTEPSPTPTTSGPAAASAPPGTGAPGGAGGGVPLPRPPVVSIPGGPVVSPPQPPKPPSFQVTDVIISPGIREGRTGSWTVTVTTNRAQGTVRLSSTFSVGDEAVGTAADQKSGAPYVFNPGWDFGSPCQDWTITVVTEPGSVRKSGTIPGDPKACDDGVGIG